MEYRRPRRLLAPEPNRPLSEWRRQQHEAASPDTTGRRWRIGGCWTTDLVQCAILRIMPVRLGELLVKERLITSQQLQEAVSE